MSTGRPAIMLIGDTLNFGGTEGQFVEVACRLGRPRWDVHVSCLRAEGPLRARLEAARVRAWSCGRGSLKSPRVLAALWELVGYIRAHGIHLVHSFDFYSNILGIPAARLAGVPAVIASQRDLGDVRPGLQRRLHRMMLRLADHILVNSETVAERVKLDRTIVPGRIVVVPNGVDVMRFSPAHGGRRRSGGIMVGTLANLRPEKGIEDLVRAAARVVERCPESRFTIWGEGHLRADLERLVRTLGLGGAVELRGSTAEPEVALRETDIFVLPSRSEACSNALLEAMASGLPIVATQVGGNPSLVEHEATGLLVPPADPAALAEAIIRLIDEPAFAAELAARGRDRIRSEFGMDLMMARIEAVYEQALGRHRRDACRGSCGGDEGFGPGRRRPQGREARTRAPAP